jgi:hypothetical protein
MNRSVHGPAGSIAGVSAALVKSFYVGSLSVLLAGLVGCNGDDGSSGPPSGALNPGQTPTPQNAKPSGRGSVVVTVTDALGVPQVGAMVWIDTIWNDEDKQALTDAAGRAAFDGVIADKASVQAWTDESVGRQRDVAVSANESRSVTVVTAPAHGTSGGIAAASVAAGGVRDAGRELEFTLSIVQAPDPWTGWNWSEGVGVMRVEPCAPDAANDAPRFQPDCVSGADGYDASYAEVYDALAIPTRRVTAPVSARAASTALMLDQSSSFAVADPADRRLFATKYLLSRTSDRYAVALVAFAADDPASGQFALLPRTPVTLFPVESPRSASDGWSLFGEVDSLAMLEGGRAPLLAAIDWMLDSARAGTDLVIVTDGRDTTCGTSAQCRVQLDAVMEKSRRMDVGILAVGLAPTSGGVGQQMLGLLAQSHDRGAMFWAWDPRQLAQILGTVQRYQNKEIDTLSVTFRIRSEVAGTFAAGRTVLGQVRHEICPFDCITTYIPFVVRIP